MAGSLFDQLKKSGLVNEHKAKQIKREKYQQTKQPKSQKDLQSENDAAKLVAEAKRLKAEKDRQLNLERQQQQAERAKQAELKQILQSNQLKGFGGEIAFNFADDKQVKTLQVNATTHQRLGSGKIRIARLEGAYLLIPDTAVEKIELRDPSVLIPFADKDDSSSQQDQDYYAKFEIPDDLVW
ncbi:DUF2058 domain-containing protein [Thiomicrospira sp. R3]|uniref:DUF2058 domain-containing protein n=1 Tax=Thiomicrospira sp. R3 TaxID=3035472 RepID=UPI00259BE29F|nr:DUF2058 domain-containing protein [Thiomicrospira sp. R3]WFE68195.1 DUF2058 domain-containing protein [Thiomicrospira sp. R3]